jgi:hypothetical protein
MPPRVQPFPFEHHFVLQNYFVGLFFLRIPGARLPAFPHNHGLQDAFGKSTVNQQPANSASIQHHQINIALSM